MARATVCDGDGARLQQVVSTLLGNAIKFTDRGGCITVTVDQDEAVVCVVVEDTGQGIAGVHSASLRALPSGG